MIIDRSKWFYGFRFGGISCLYDSKKDKKCCLGFLACELGADPKSIDKQRTLNCEWPGEVQNVCAWPKILFKESFGIGSGQWERWLAKINDVQNVDDELRESWIKAGFKYLMNIDVEFVGDYPP